MDHLVKAECVDTRTGKRYFVGDPFPNPTAEQLVRLSSAGCIEKEPIVDLSDKAVADMSRQDLEIVALDSFMSHVQSLDEDRLRDMVEEMRRREADGADIDPTDGAVTPSFDDMTIAELKEHADKKGVDLGSATKKDDIIAAIKAAEES
jgi:hypothetical protein